MARSEEDARERLQRAALELFAEHGYDRTTAAGIAARAGVTERTFFRYFPDKREVLFDGGAILRIRLTDAIVAAPAGLAPFPMLFHAFRSVLPMMEAGRPYVKLRQDIISATPALHERELAKLAMLSDALAEALKAQGVADLRASLAARTAMAAFAQVTTAWLDDPEPGLGERLDLAYRELKALLAEIDR